MTTSVANAESAAIRSYLDGQRNHVLGILDGLDEAALRRPMLPSGWNALWLLRHLAIDVERFWFRAVIAGDPQVIAGFAAHPGNAWTVGDGETAERIIALYREEVAHANVILEHTPLDAGPAWWPEGLFGEWRVDKVRQLVLHVMTETACHAGHLDAARELIDGRQWLVLP